MYQDLLPTVRNLKELLQRKILNLLILPYVVKALVSALREYPALNTSIDDETEEIIQKHYYNIGIAADTERGLLVPVVKHADSQISILLFHRKSMNLADKARDRKTIPE